MTESPPAPAPETPVHELTSAQATERLEAMTAAYQKAVVDPSDPSTQLARLSADEQWRARLFQGCLPERKQLDELTGAGRSKLDAAIAGHEPPPGLIETGGADGLTQRQMLPLIDALSEAGVSDAAIRESFTGVPTDPKTYTIVREFRTARLANADWVKRYLAGDFEANREMLLANIVISNFEGATP